MGTVEEKQNVGTWTVTIVDYKQHVYAIDINQFLKATYASIHN